MKRKTICMIAGEASADKHAAAVIRKLQGMMPGVEIFGMGGPEMLSAGMECIYGIHEFSVMGFSDVLPRIGRIFSVFRGLMRAINERKPDVIVPVDLPDFNMGLAKKAKKSGFKVLYFIAPQAWAWRRNRARTLARITDGLAVIFPFEQAFFSSYGVNARYVGHPFMEARADARPIPAKWPPRDIVLMPGSRRHEVETILPSMIDAKRIIERRHPDIRWSLRLAPGLDRKRVQSLAGSDINLSSDFTAADLALVKSGTSSFEMAVAGIPEVICYRTSALNYLLARIFVQVDNIGMPNIILGRPAVPELIQHALTGEGLAGECLALMENEGLYRRMQKDFEEMRALLGAGNPSQEVAEWIRSMIS